MNSSSLTDIDAGRLRMHRKRKRMNVVALSLSLAAMAFGMFWLAWILFETIRLGAGGIALSVFTEMTPPPQAESGGLANAIAGSLVMVGLATLTVRPFTSNVLVRLSSDRDLPTVSRPMAKPSPATSAAVVTRTHLPGAILVR